MNKPTIDEYNKAKQNIQYLGDCIWRCKKEQDELMDKIATSRQNEKIYIEAKQKAKETIMIYELYEIEEANTNDKKGN